MFFVQVMSTQPSMHWQIISNSSTARAEVEGSVEFSRVITMPKMRTHSYLDRWAAIVVVSCALGLCIGCGSDGLGTAPVSGTVTLDGEPVEGAGVMFNPVKPGPIAIGTTDAAGRFVLATGKLPGAMLGEHRITLSKSLVLNSTQQKQEGPLAGRQFATLKPLLPERYLRPETSGLQEFVESKDNQFELQLTTKP